MQYLNMEPMSNFSPTRINLWIGPTVGKFDQHIGHYSSLIRSVDRFGDLPLFISWHSHYDNDRYFVPFDEAQRKLVQFQNIAKEKFGITGEYYSLESDQEYIGAELNRLATTLDRHPRGIYQSRHPTMTYFREVAYDTGFTANGQNVVLYDRRMQFVYMYHYICKNYPSVDTIELTLGSDLTTFGHLITQAIDEFRRCNPEYARVKINIHACGLLTFQSKKISKSKIHSALLHNGHNLINVVDANAFRKLITKYDYTDPIEFDVMDCYGH